MKLFRIFFFYTNTLLFFCHAYSEELCKSGFFADAAILFWRANEEGLSFAVESSSTNRLAPDATVENPDFEWDVGFKVGLGFRVPHDRWDLLLEFTSFQTHSDTDKKARGGNVLFPLWQKSIAESPSFAEEAKVHWRLHLGIVDLMLSKFYWITKSFFLTPQIGLRAGSIRQKYYLEYRGGSFLAAEEEIIHMKNKYFGIGPNVGLMSQWSLGNGFSIFGQCSLALLYGEFYVHQDEYGEDGKTKLLGVHDIFRSSTAVLDSSTGLRWQQFFRGALKALELEIAWDQLLFFTQNQLLHFTNAGSQGVFFSNQGDLAVSGVQFNMRFDF
jgi:hypothetical protein